MQGIYFLIILSGRLRFTAEAIPLIEQVLKIGGNAWFELGYALCAKGMGNGFPLSSMFFAISGVEETTVNGDEGVVVFTIIFREEYDMDGGQRVWARTRRRWRLDEEKE